MPPKFRELSSLRYNELTETRTRKRDQRDRVTAPQTRDVDAPCTSSESDAAPGVSGCSTPKESDPAVAGALRFQHAMQLTPEVLPMEPLDEMPDSEQQHIVQDRKHTVQHKLYVTVPVTTYFKQ